MEYRVFSMSSGEDDNSTEAHVFARAYRWAWRSVHGREPAGRHQVDALELVMDFGEPASAAGTSYAGPPPTASRIKPASPASNVPPEGQHDN